MTLRNLYTFITLFSSIVLINGCAPAYSPPAQTYQMPPLHTAAVQNDIPTIERLLKEGADINQKGIVQNNVLHSTVMHGKPETVKYLLDHGANPNAQNQSNTTPLAYAVWGENEDNARLLLAKGANINAVDAAGWTPIHYWAIYNKKSIHVAKFLLEYGADANRKDGSGKTPLMLAQQFNNPNASEFGNYLATFTPPKTIPQFETQPLKPAIITAPAPKNNDLQVLIQKKDYTALKEFLNQHPEQFEAISEPTIKLLMTGDHNLRVYDIKTYITKKMNETLIIAKVNSSGTAFKNFSMEEIEQLQKQGFSDNIIASMISVTSEIKKSKLASATPKPISAPQVYQQTPAQQQPLPSQPTLGETVGNELMKEGARQLIHQFLPF